MRQKSEYKQLGDYGIYSGEDYFESDINNRLSQLNLTPTAYERLWTALKDSYSSMVEFLSLDDPYFPEDLTWSQLKLLQMNLEELNKERDYRLADYFCREVAGHVIDREIKTLKKLGIAKSPRKGN